MGGDNLKMYRNDLCYGPSWVIWLGVGEADWLIYMGIRWCDIDYFWAINQSPCHCGDWQRNIFNNNLTPLWEKTFRPYHLTRRLFFRLWKNLFCRIQTIHLNINVKIVSLLYKISRSLHPIFGGKGFWLFWLVRLKLRVILGCLVLVIVEENVKCCLRALFVFQLLFSPRFVDILDNVCVRGKVQCETWHFSEFLAIKDNKLWGDDLDEILRKVWTQNILVNGSLLWLLTQDALMASFS